MNWSEMSDDWGHMKLLVQSRWPKLTEEDLTAVDANRDRLALLLQGRYALGPEQTEHAICEFEKDVRRPGAVK